MSLLRYTNQMPQKYLPLCVVASDLWHVFLRVLVSSTNKTDCHDITEILLKKFINLLSDFEITFYIDTELLIQNCT
jgi:hypothetical protein